MRFRSTYMMKAIVTLVVGFVTSSSVLAVSITINADVATGPITDQSNIPVDGWVYAARTYTPNPVTKQNDLTATNANKVKIYLFYQQVRPNADGTGGSVRYQLDATAGTLDAGSGNPDSSYMGSVTANMPAQTSTTVTAHCWFLRSEAILDTAVAPNVLVTYIEKDVNLVWTTPPAGP
jgi:hypothetical protein